VIEAAIVGLGRWGQSLVRSVQGRSERLRFVRGVVRHPEPVRGFDAEHGLVLSSSLATALGDDRVQAVVLATPHSLHADQVVAVASAGRAVCCEKPLALARADAERAVAACEDAGVVLAAGYDKRFWPSMLELKRVVASGALGDILHVEGNTGNEVSRGYLPKWRESPSESPGGSMTASGIHVVDAFVSLVGPARRVQAQLISRQTRPEPLDTVAILFEFENRVSGVLCSVRSTPFYWRVHVFGTRGSAEAIGETGIVLRLSGEPPQQRSFEPVDALRCELEAFADAIEGRAAYPVSPSEAVAGVAALEAIVHSMEWNAPVVVGAARG